MRFILKYISFVAYVYPITFLWMLILKMLGLYLDTHIIDHKLCYMLSIVDALTLQKELHIFLTKMCFRQKSKTTTTSKLKRKNQ